MFGRRLSCSIAQDIALGSAWAANSVNCVPYRHAAILSDPEGDTVSYYNQDGQIVIARVSDNGRYDAIIPNQRQPYDAHQAISIGIDHHRRLHVAFGAHDSSILITRSHSERLSDGFATLLPHGEQSRLTYPMFLTAKDEPLFLYRAGSSSDGAIYASRIDPVSGKWIEDKRPFVSGRQANPVSGPYLNTPVIGADGKITCFIVWRLPPGATSGGAVVNAGIDCFQSHDGFRTVQTYNGLRLVDGVTPSASERVVAVPLGSSLINQASAAAMPNGDPAVITYWDAGDGVPQYRLAYVASGQWVVRQVSNFATRFSLAGGGTLPLPHSRPELFFDDAARAYVVFRSAEYSNRLILRVLEPPFYDWRSASQHVLVDEDLGFYEPVISRSAWDRQRRLVMFVQPCQQFARHDGVVSHLTATARLMSWNPVVSRRRWVAGFRMSAQGLVQGSRSLSHHQGRLWRR
jgi:hypothetical protein